MTEFKALVVGGASAGGVGGAIADALRDHPHYDSSRMDMVTLNVYTPPQSVLDVTWVDEVREWVAENGPFHYIVYAAGYNELMWIRDVWCEDFEKAMRINCGGFVEVISAHEDAFSNSHGSAIAIASDAARNAMRGSLNYCASKAALVMAAKVMARELAPRWRVNTVSPAVIANTPMSESIDLQVQNFRGWTAEQAQEYERTQLPMGRRATTREVATVVLNTLFGPGYQTGSDVQISGGK